MTRIYCMACNDKNHFKMKVNDARNINHRLEEILTKYGKVQEMEKSDALHAFASDCIHQHFMCGHCPNVNESELRTEEDRINNNLLKLCHLIKTKDIDANDYHLTLRLLSGHYPGKYRALEKVWQKEKILKEK